MRLGTAADTEGEPRRTQRSRTELSTRRLLLAAAELIGEQGYERTTAVQIGERAGYSRGMVRERFGSKEGLLIALLDRMTEEWHTDVIRPRARETNAVEVIIGYLDRWQAELREQPETLRAFYVLMAEAVAPIPGLRPRIKAENQRLLTLVETALRQGLEAGSIRAEIEPVAHSTLYVSAVRGAAYQWTLDPEGFDLDGIIDLWKSLLRTTLTPR